MRAALNITSFKLEAAMNEMDSGNNTGKWMALGCGIVLAIGLCCGGAFAGLVWLGAQNADETVRIEMDVPIDAEVGGPYNFTITVTNITSAEVSIDSIDITTGFLDGFVLDSVTPAYIETYEFDSLGNTYQTYSFDETIPPGGEILFNFSGRAVLPGDFSGEIDVCVTVFACTTNVVRTIVR
jgi:hypothetical protein